MKTVRVLGIAVASLVLALAGTAVAEDGKALLRAGIEKLNRGSLKEAESDLEKASTLLPRGKDRAKALLHLGLARAYRQRYAAAKRDFARALTNDPLVMVDPERVPPKVQQAFAEARSTVSGTLAARGGGAGAVLEVNGKARGSLPISLTLPVGAHEIRIVDSKKKTLRKERVVIGAGSRIEVALATPLTPPVAPAKPPPPKVSKQVTALAKKPGPAVVKKPPVPAPPPKPNKVAATSKPMPAPPAKAKPNVVAKAVSKKPAPTTKAPRLARSMRSGETIGLRTGTERSWFTPMRIAGASALSAAVVLGFVSAGFGLSAKGAEDRFNELRSTGTDTEVLQLREDALNRSRYSNIFLGVSLAAAAAGLVLVIWPRGNDNPASSSPSAISSVRVVPTGLGALLALEY